ncbi:SCO1664 family protein [Rathayibacter iranicus]|uniref:Phosphatidylinositol kinase n=2 Tax=Rathayibacter iranicus TaxID=59737 RepID=A0AAD1AGM9_9MICO|nr:SCO1664 family protein [Rathayibacter iranicus]AZZ56920.1 phosphatidylinositol kinase [Rathayibacter iranicus]MWV29518.1 SCO1664 family protein [Rathayibacter iranicus NCPPB 2253 = VKM Ac-1602]PPI42434.1 phosphatidylinositol kinase [Rathayibacter iranicus]PPI57856.1 phosphatidylinositol kinase [Rathayibacter iranicus]PPI68794.1 phosphatidylinositol kinase [Rathayibacter iranicus]
MSTAGGLDGELELAGRITVASNATFLARLGDASVVYKPVSGEKPLWDFPDGVLAGREVAAYLVSEALGWNVVPHTWLRDGPLGPGMVQLWQDIDPEQGAVDVVPAGAMPEGWRHVFDGSDEDNREISLVHEDSTALRRMAVFDVVVNNADRKGGHVLALPDGHRYGVDHGLTFHAEHKLRTVLWGWIGEPLLEEELTALALLRRQVDGSLGATLSELLTEDEVAAFAKRCERLGSFGRFPGPRGDMPAVPWPLF